MPKSSLTVKEQNALLDVLDFTAALFRDTGKGSFTAEEVQSNLHMVSTMSDTFDAQVIQSRKEARRLARAS